MKKTYLSILFNLLASFSIYTLFFWFFIMLKDNQFLLVAKSAIALTLVSLLFFIPAFLLASLMMWLFQEKYKTHIFCGFIVFFTYGVLLSLIKNDIEMNIFDYLSFSTKLSISFFSTICFLGIYSYFIQRQA